MPRLLSLLVLLLLLAQSAIGQDVPARAVKFYSLALTARQKHKDAKAIAYMQKALNEYPAYNEAYSILGKWYQDDHQYAKAKDVWTRAAASCKDGQRIFAKPLAETLLALGDYNGALQVLPAGKMYDGLRKQAQFLQTHKGVSNQRPVNYTPWRINTPQAELFPQLSADGRYLYYTRTSNGVDDDFYRAERDTCGGWLAGRPMGYPLNTTAQELAQMVSADRHYLFFTRCDNRSPNGWEAGGCDLYMSYTADSVWSTPQSLGATINTSAYEGMPCLSPDNRELFFVSDREGGFGGKDIWSSTFENRVWQMPKNLGPLINSAGDETAPFLCADNQTLLFASTGLPGYGGSDLFLSKRMVDSIWSEPVNLGAPINSVANEASASVNLAGDTILFSTDRDSLHGNMDIYALPLVRNFQPAKVVLLSGFVTDSLSGETLTYAAITLRNEAGKEFEVQSNRGDGSYTIALPLHHTWYCQIARMAYQRAFDTVRTDSLYLWPPMEKNFALLPFDYVRTVTDTLLTRFYFQKNNTEVDDNMKAVLTENLSDYSGRKDITIVINSYTDDSGTPMMNEQLSSMRANNIRDLIIQLGYDSSQLEAHGFGEANAIAPNDNESNRNLNRRVEIIIRQ